VADSDTFIGQTFSHYLWLANCCFAHISLGFPFLLRFCDELWFAKTPAPVKSIT
jgi:hypothetical protein